MRARDTGVIDVRPASRAVFLGYQANGLAIGSYPASFRLTKMETIQAPALQEKDRQPFHDVARVFLARQYETRALDESRQRWHDLDEFLDGNIVRVRGGLHVSIHNEKIRV